MQAKFVIALKRIHMCTHSPTAALSFSLPKSYIFVSKRFPNIIIIKAANTQIRCQLTLIG